jgi:hypothetical protein
VWALEGFGAAYILQELLTIKSDAMHGREQVIHAILENKPMVIGTPESFKVLVRELQSVCLDIYSSQIIGPFSKRNYRYCQITVIEIEILFFQIFEA